MAMQEANLGGRVPLLEPRTMTGSQKSLYDSILESAVPWAQSAGFLAALPDGKVIGPFNLALQSPEIGAAFAKLQSTEESSTTLNPRIRQIVILTVGAIWKCDYERYAHKAVAEKVGLAPQVIHAVAEGSEPQGLAEDESLAWQVTGTSRWITGYLRIFSTGHNQLSEIRGSSICCSLLGVMSLFALC